MTVLSKSLRVAAAVAVVAGASCAPQAEARVLTGSSKKLATDKPTAAETEKTQGEPEKTLEGVEKAKYILANAEIDDLATATPKQIEALKKKCGDKLTFSWNTEINNCIAEITKQKKAADDKKEAEDRKAADEKKLAEETKAAEAKKAADEAKAAAEKQAAKEKSEALAKKFIESKKPEELKEMTGEEDEIKTECGKVEASYIPWRRAVPANEGCVDLVKEKIAELKKKDTPTPVTPITPPAGTTTPDAPITPPAGPTTPDAPIAPPAGTTTPDAPITPPAGPTTPDAPTTPPAGTTTPAGQTPTGPAPAKPTGTPSQSSSKKVWIAVGSVAGVVGAVAAFLAFACFMRKKKSEEKADSASDSESEDEAEELVKEEV